MEEKYSLNHIITKTWRRFSKLDECKESKAHDFKIYIEIKAGSSEKYIMGGHENNFFLLKFTLRKTESTITSPMNLVKDKHLLGKVDVEFKGMPIKSYQNYDEFWEDIMRE